MDKLGGENAKNSVNTPDVLRLLHSNVGKMCQNDLHIVVRYAHNRKTFAENVWHGNALVSGEVPEWPTGTRCSWT